MKSLVKFTIIGALVALLAAGCSMATPTPAVLPTAANTAIPATEATEAATTQPTEAATVEASQTAEPTQAALACDGSQYPDAIKVVNVYGTPPTNIQVPSPVSSKLNVPGHSSNVTWVMVNTGGCDLANMQFLGKNGNLVLDSTWVMQVDGQPDVPKDPKTDTWHPNEQWAMTVPLVWVADATSVTKPLAFSVITADETLTLQMDLYSILPAPAAPSGTAEPTATP
jgi:hypothetical protein